MDIISHGLYSSILLGRKNRKSFWTSFIFGILPDFLAFAPFFAMTMFGRIFKNWEFGEPPPYKDMPDYVHYVYNFSHSLVVFVILFLVLWLVFRRPIWEFLGWGLHILVDIPLHTTNFFPTPFLWPISDLYVNGHPWSDPYIFVPNVIFLSVLYFWYFKVHPKRRTMDINTINQ